MTDAAPDPGGTEIVTEGVGWYEQPGDRAELTVGFTATAPNRADAVRDLGRRIAAARPVMGRPELTTTHRRLWVQNAWRGTRVVGCQAGESIGLLLVEVGALEEVLAALVGAEPTELTGPRWLLADEAAARREAQRRALEDARQRAEGYAAALDARLGPLRRLSEAPDHGGVFGREMAVPAMADAADVRDLSLEPEPVRVTVRCTTTWTLLYSE